MTSAYDLVDESLSRAKNNAQIALEQWHNLPDELRCFGDDTWSKLELAVQMLGRVQADLDSALEAA